MSTSTTQQIREFAKGHSLGTPISAKHLLHMGSRAAVDQALSRLARSGELRRVARGVYVRPKKTRFGQSLPALERFLEGLQQLGETVVPSVSAEANRLGLTTQVPIRSLWLTSGPSRVLKWGAQEVELRHARRELLLPRTQAGEVIRALEWAGPERLDNAWEKIRSSLTESNRKSLLALRPQLSSRNAAVVSRLSAA